MTNLGAANQFRAIFALIFVLLFRSQSFAQNHDKDWLKTKARIEKELGTDEASRRKIITPEQAIAICQENERQEKIRIPQRQRYFAHSPDAAFQWIAQHILPKLYAQSKKNLSLGALNLNEMFSRFKEVEVCENYYTETPMQGDSDRKTELYYHSPERKFVILNQQFGIIGANEKKEIIVHVFLGASGYEDENYQLTHALFAAENSINAQTAAAFPQTKEQLYRQPNNKPLGQRPILDDRQIIVAGGFTGGVGGGDGSSSMIKGILSRFAPRAAAYTKQYNLPCQQQWSDQITYTKDIQILNIETNKEAIVLNWKPELGTRNLYLRRALGNYYIFSINTIYTNGKDVTAESEPAQYIAFGILVDYCRAKYGGQ